MKPRTWTREQIRKAILLPKPTGAERLITDPDSLIRDLDPPERRALRAIAENADLIDERGTDAHGRGVAFLLVTVPPWVVDLLAGFEAERGDDLGACDDREPDADGEPWIGSNERVSQLGWAANAPGASADCEAVDEDGDDGDCEPNIIAPDNLYRDTTTEKLPALALPCFTPVYETAG